MKEHYDIRVTGRVQGVFYRASTQQKAQELGLAGWVKNESDGSVVIEAEGETDKLRSLVEWCKSGPPTARVQDIHVEISDTFKNYDDFGVKR